MSQLRACIQFMEGTGSSSDLVVVRLPFLDLFLPADQVEPLIATLRLVVKDKKHHKVTNPCVCNKV